MDSINVRCRVMNDVRLTVSIIDDHDLVALTSTRVRRAKPYHYQYPALPAKRWWNEYISMVHPDDRTKLHRFLGLS